LASPLAIDSAATRARIPLKRHKRERVWRVHGTEFYAALPVNSRDSADLPRRTLDPSSSPLLRSFQPKVFEPGLFSRSGRAQRTCRRKSRAFSPHRPGVGGSSASRCPGLVMQLVGQRCATLKSQGRSSPHGGCAIRRPRRHAAARVSSGPTADFDRLRPRPS
jgi:hypothetical protein